MFTEVLDSWYCHCNTCRRGSGAPVSAWAKVERSDLTFEGGALATLATEAGGTRHFCSLCGTTLFRETCGECAVPLGCLADPAAIEPKQHRSAGTQVPWLKLNDLLSSSVGPEIVPHEKREFLRKPKVASISAQSEVSLREVRKENHSDVLLMDVQGGQFRYVANNSVSLVQAVYEENAWYRVIYADETPVGFVMTTIDKDDSEGQPTKGCPFLWRFLIDANYQGMGFGTRGLTLTIAEEHKRAPGRDFWTSAVHGSTGPMEFYCRFGFEDTGVDDGNERILRLRQG